jgi:hypothetical protein
MGNCGDAGENGLRVGLALVWPAETVTWESGRVFEVVSCKPFIEPYPRGTDEIESIWPLQSPAGPRCKRRISAALCSNSCEFHVPLLNRAIIETRSLKGNQIAVLLLIEFCGSGANRVDKTIARVQGSFKEGQPGIVILLLR